MGRNAGKGADADEHIGLVVDGADLLGKAVRRLQELMDQGHDPRPVGRQPNAEVAALKQAEAHFALQRVHHMRQAGLRIAQHIRRAGKAALGHGGDHGFEFFRIHIVAPFRALPVFDELYII